MSPLLTCVTCRAVFNDIDGQKKHYKSDWHQYNLKRKVASLPPVVVDEFEKIRKLNNDSEDGPKNKDDGVYCSVCKRSFHSKKTFENHLKSKKHIDLQSSSEIDNSKVCLPACKVVKPKPPESDIETDSEIEEVSSDEWDEVVSYNNPILKNNCLFCPHHSASLTKAVKHMSTEHSFFIPDIEFLADLKGLLLYLGEKICQGFICIWCNEAKSGFSSMESAQSHMRDKGHTKMLYNTDTMKEYVEFYYFDEEFDIDELKDKSDADNNYDANEEDCMMVLPSGQTIGHRSLASFYKQRHRSAPIVLKNKKLQKVMNYYRAIGWTSSTKECVERKLRDTKYADYVRSKNVTKLSVKSNKLQKHFRPQVDF